MTTILATAKAWAALVGTLLTALVGTLTPDDPGYRLLTIALALVTAVAVYQVPNLDDEGERQDESVQPPEDFDDRGATTAEAVLIALGILAVVFLVCHLVR